MQKFFVLDTNVLLHDPRSIESFDDNIVVLPITVIEELDTKKKGTEEINRNAREAVRILDKYRSRGYFDEGIKTPSGGKICIEINNKEALENPPKLDLSIPDNRILAVAYNLTKKEQGHDNRRDVVVVSKDLNVRVKANALRILADDYNNDKVKIDELYKGWQEVQVSNEVVDTFHRDKFLSLDGDFQPNEFVILINKDRPKHTAIARYNAKVGHFVPLIGSYDMASGIAYRNIEQRMALDLLMNHEIDFVSLVGQAGTGKTLLALAAGLECVHSKRHDQVLVSRPIIPMGKDIGYLPGEKNEKLYPWMQPIHDNLDFITSRGRKNEDDKKGSKKINQSIKTDQVVMEALAYIQGRTIFRSFIIIDETQNLTKDEVKTIVSRAGEGTKMVFTGDPHQINNPYLDSASNGLVYLVEKLKSLPTIGHVTLEKTERSSLAKIAAEYL